MHIAISGASGFIGRRLVETLEQHDHRILRLKRWTTGDGRAGEPGSGRRATGPDHSDADPRLAAGKQSAGETVSERRAAGPDLSADPPLDAVVQLAGEPVSQRWNAKVKQRIRESRVAGTRLLVDAMGRLAVRPRVLVCASAVGYYGDRGDQLLDESAGPAGGFLAEVCQEWEAEAERAEALGIRVVRIRFGVVLGKDGGALGKMLPLFRLGLGARLGDGRQWMSWIHRDDLTAMIEYALEHEDARGAWNGVSPNPVTNAEFTRQLAAAVRRPAFLVAPRWLVRLGAGEMAQILFFSQRVVPAAPLAAGFRFRYPELGAALRSVVS